MQGHVKQQTGMNIRQDVASAKRQITQKETATTGRTRSQSEERSKVLFLTEKQEIGEEESI